MQAERDGVGLELSKATPLIDNLSIGPEKGVKDLLKKNKSFIQRLLLDTKK